MSFMLSGVSLLLLHFPLFLERFAGLLS